MDGLGPVPKFVVGVEDVNGDGDVNVAVVGGRGSRLPGEKVDLRFER